MKTNRFVQSEKIYEGDNSIVVKNIEDILSVKWCKDTGLTIFFLEDCFISDDAVFENINIKVLGKNMSSDLSGFKFLDTVVEPTTGIIVFHIFYSRSQGSDNHYEP